MLAQLAEDRFSVPWQHAEADMIDIARFLARRSAAHASEPPVDRHQVNQGRSHAQLVEPDLLLLLLPASAEHLDVEADDLLQVDDAEHDVVDALNVDHCHSSAGRARLPLLRERSKEGSSDAISTIPCVSNRLRP